MTTFNYVQVAPNSIGLKIDTAEVVSSAGGNPTVERQIVSLGDPTTYGNVAAIKAASTAPSSLDPALVVALSPNSANLPVVVGTALPTGTNVIGGAVNYLINPFGAAVASGSVPAVANPYNQPASTVVEVGNIDGQSMYDLLQALVNEMKINNVLLSEIAAGRASTSDPADLRQDATLFQ